MQGGWEKLVLPWWSVGSRKKKGDSKVTTLIYWKHAAAWIECRTWDEKVWGSVLTTIYMCQANFSFRAASFHLAAMMGTCRNRIFLFALQKMCRVLPSGDETVKVCSSDRGVNCADRWTRRDVLTMNIYIHVHLLLVLLKFLIHEILWHLTTNNFINSCQPWTFISTGITISMATQY